MVWVLSAAVVLSAAAGLCFFGRGPCRRSASPDLSEVRRLAETGRVNDAVALYRKVVRVDQAEAEVAIDRIIRGHPPYTPPTA